MSGINRQPSGLLSFFGIKNSGRNPQAIAETLAPTLDLARWYLAQSSESLSFTANVTVVGHNPGFFTVPETETWAVLGCTVNSQAALGAGQTLQLGGAWIRNPTVAIVQPLTTIGDVATVGQVAVAWSPVGSLEFAPPGARIGVYVTQLVAGPVSTTMNLTVVRMLL